MINIRALFRGVLASSNYKSSFRFANKYLSTDANLTSKRLEDKIAVITGAANGIGAKTAELFTRHGAKVIIGDIDDKNGAALAKELGEDNLFSHCDVSVEDDIKALVNLAVSKHGRLDIMLNNGGVLCPTPNVSIVDMDAEDLDYVLRVNLRGMALGVKHASRAMIPAKSGCILLTASIAAVASGLAYHPYAISKCGVLGVVKSAAAELAQHGIRINCVSPGCVETGIMDEFEKFYPDMVAATRQTRIDPLQRQDLTRLLAPEELANTYLALASDEMQFISGQNIVVDGNLSNMGPWNIFKVA